MMSLRNLIGSHFGSLNSHWSVMAVRQQNSYDPDLSYPKCIYIFKISTIKLAITRTFVSCSRGTMELEYEKYEQVTVERLPTGVLDLL